MTASWDLEGLSDVELVALWFHANAVLHRRGAKLWHAGDLAEILVAAAVGGTRASNNVQPGYDVVDPGGRRWQVKALVNRPGYRRSSAGHLAPGSYDVLAIVEFAEDMRSVRAWQVPPEVVAEYSRWDESRGKFRVEATRRLLADPRVKELPLDLPLPPARRSS